MSTTNSQSAVGFIGTGEQGLPMATAIAVAGYPLLVWARHPGLLSHHLPRRRRPGERLIASVVEVLEISQAEQESRKSAARGTLNFSELRHGEVRRIHLLRASVNTHAEGLCSYRHCLPSRVCHPIGSTAQASSACPQ